MKTAAFALVLTLYLYLIVGFVNNNGFYVLGLTCGAFISGVLVHDEVLKRQHSTPLREDEE